MDGAHRALLGGQFVYIFSYDIAGAFDRVTHHQLMGALPMYGIDTYTRRLVHNWLAGRTFQLKLRLPAGTF